LPWHTCCFFPPGKAARQDVAVRDESFERMRQAIHAIAAESGRVGPDVLDRYHDLRGLLFAIFAAGAAQRPACLCRVNRTAAAALPDDAGNEA
jgi:hypothetical protein